MTPGTVGALAETRLRQLAVLASQLPVRVDQQLGLVLEIHTIAEAYVDAILQALIAATEVDRTAFGRAMLAQLEDRIFASWKERHDWLAKGFGIRVQGTVKQDLLTIADLRNAIVHGNGRLTERQSRDIVRLVELENRLYEVLDVRTERREVYLGRATGEKSVAIARAYIQALDAEVRSQHSNARI